MTKKIFLILTSLLLIASCLASCNDVTNIETSDTEERESVAESTSDTETEEKPAEEEETSAKETETEVQQKWGLVTVPGIGKIIVSTETKKAELNFYNPKANNDICFFEFELYIKKSDGSTERIYKSAMVSPEGSIESVTLEKELAVGSYDALIKLQPYTMDGSVTKMDVINIDTKIEVKEPAKKQTLSGGGVGLVVDPNAGNYDKVETEVQAGIAIPGWGEITIPPNQTENIIVDFYNPEANADRYYLAFELYLTNEDGSKDVLYKSDLVPPGQHIQRITLAHALEVGEYEATMHVQPYKIDGTLASTNNLDAKTKLIVK